MSDKDFELVVICGQGQSGEVLNVIKDLGVDFKFVGERAFAPASTDTAIRILVAFAELLPLIIMLVKKIREKGANMDFETRHRLARRMLTHLEPLYELQAEDKADYSYYEFKTAACKHYWKLDRGEIAHGPLRCT